MLQGTGMGRATDVALGVYAQTPEGSLEQGAEEVERMVCIPGTSAHHRPLMGAFQPGPVAGQHPTDTDRAKTTLTVTVICRQTGTNIPSEHSAEMHCRVVARVSSEQAKERYCSIFGERVEHSAGSTASGSSLLLQMVKPAQ